MQVALKKAPIVPEPAAFSAEGPSASALMAPIVLPQATAGRTDSVSGEETSPLPEPRVSSRGSSSASQQDSSSSLEPGKNNRGGSSSASGRDSSSSPDVGIKRKRFRVRGNSSSSSSNDDIVHDDMVRQVLNNTSNKPKIGHKRILKLNDIDSNEGCLFVAVVFRMFKLFIRVLE